MLFLFSFAYIFLTAVRIWSLSTPLNTPAEMLHIHGNIPLGLANSGRVAAVSLVAKKTKQKWKFFSTKKASCVHMAQGSPGQDGQPSLLRDAGEPPTWGRGWVRSTLLAINLLLEKGPETFRARTQILNQNLLKSSIVPISQNQSLNNSFIFLFFFIIIIIFFKENNKVLSICKIVLLYRVSGC